MLKYIKNELKPKEQNKYMNTLKNLDAILHEQLLEIIDSQIFNGASILNAIKICNELKRNLQDFHNAAYAGEKYDFGASAFNVDISMEDTVYKFDLESRLPHTLRADSKLNPLLGEQADSFFSTCFRAMKRYYEKNPFDKFQHVFVLFTIFYEENEFWVDPDNINYKPFIDACVKNFFVIDDNSKYVSIISISKQGRPHTEVFVASDISALVKYI